MGHGFHDYVSHNQRVTSHNPPTFADSTGREGLAVPRLEIWGSSQEFGQCHPNIQRGKRMGKDGKGTFFEPNTYAKMALSNLWFLFSFLLILL